MKITSLLIYTIAISSSISALDNNLKERLSCHKVLKNYTQAITEIDEALITTPNDPSLIREKILFLALRGNEHDALLHYLSLPKDLQDDILTEEIAWSIIRKGAASNNPLLRFEALLAASQSGDSRAVILIQNGLHDNNISIRALAYSVATSFRDALFFEDAKSAIANDPSPEVRSLALQLLGSMHTKNSEIALREHLLTTQMTHEEKEVTIASLSMLLDGVSKEDALQLLRSENPTMRHLAWRLLRNSPDSIIEIQTTIEQLFCEENAEDVGLEALLTLAYLETLQQTTLDKIQSLVEKSSLKTQCTSCFVLLLRGTEDQKRVAKEKLSRILDSSSIEDGAFASCILLHSGKQGLEISKQFFAMSQNPFVRINLSIALLKQKILVEDAAIVLKNTLRDEKSRIEFRDTLVFNYVAPFSENRISYLPAYPETIDFLSRLQLISLLAVSDDKSKEVVSITEVESLMKDKKWGATFQAASLLLEEWPQGAVELIKSLLTSDDKEVRLQAAVLLAITHQDSESLTILFDSYETAPYSMKEQILLAIGSIGSAKAIPFLITTLKDPSLTLRIRASSALLLCLYH